MKPGTALVLCFAIWFGWQRYAEHDRAIRDAQTAYKRANYEDCVDDHPEDGAERKAYCHQIWYTWGSIEITEDMYAPYLR